MTTDIKLGLLIEKFLDNNYVFRKLQIHEYFDNKEMPIRWTVKQNQFDLNEIDNSQEACELLDQNFFSDWFFYSKTQLNNFVDEFIIRNLALRKKYRKAEIKSTIEYLITQTNITKTISFNPLLKDLIKEGRYRITNVNPMSWDDNDRIDIKLSVGQKYYLCKDNEKPFIANPCYVLKQTDSRSYRVMFFTNLDDNLFDTKKRQVNGWGFTTVYANELGNTPEQAVRHRQN